MDVTHLKIYEIKTFQTVRFASRYIVQYSVLLYLLDC